MKHRIALYETENMKLKVQIEQTNHLNLELNQNLEQANEANTQLKYDMDKQQELTENLNKKMHQLNEEIENLNYQLMDQQKSDSIERLKSHNEHVLTNMRQNYETDICRALNLLQFLRVEIGNLFFFIISNRQAE
jgi:hypothetical protein